MMLRCLVGVFSILLMCCSPVRENSDPKFQMYYLQGKGLFEVHCSNCHQKDGSGLGRLFPPIDTSDFMRDNREQVICLIKHGYEEPLLVNGVQYNKTMPGNIRITELEVAEIATYIYNTWEHREGLIDVKEVSAVLDKCEPE